MDDKLLIVDGNEHLSPAGNLFDDIGPNRAEAFAERSPDSAICGAAENSLSHVRINVYARSSIAESKTVFADFPTQFKTQRLAVDWSTVNISKQILICETAKSTNEITPSQDVPQFYHSSARLERAYHGLEAYQRRESEAPSVGTLDIWV